jgi:UPF0755 protein
MIKWLFLALVIFVLAGAYGTSTYQKELTRPLTDREVVFEIKRGDSLKRVADRLVESGVLEMPYWFKFTALVEGISSQLKAGEYVAPPGVTLPGLLDLIVSGAVQQHSLLLVEGWNYRQVLRAVCSHRAIVKTLCDQDQSNFTAVFGAPDVHPEGRFFPDTYYLTKGTTDVAFLKRAADRMKEILENEWRSRLSSLPLKSADEALILASIIEKETAVADERAEISGVFIRRLEKGMLLQTDPTVIYGIGERFDGNIRSKDLSEDSPYNTYVRPGLPPTPIAMPSFASIHAALHPKFGNTLYFVSRGDGSHHFSETLSEHNRAVMQFQLKKTP